MTDRQARGTVLRFVLLVGFVNLFADLTYEGGRSITGPFLAQLGATAAMVSIISGAAEFAGYVLRSGAAYLADRTKRYWTFTFVGYAINMLAVPALALAGSWPSAAALITAERTGRAIRRPVMQGMLSHAKDTLGGGWVFGLNESLDAAGATVGPLVVAWMLARTGSYRAGFSTLLASALFCLALVAFTQRRYPRPEAFESSTAGATRFPRSYWLFMAGGAVVGFGFVDFALIAFHLLRTRALQPAAIPLAYAVAMGVGAVGNLALGALYDRAGLVVLIGAFVIGAWCTPLLFFGASPWVIFAGAGLWGFTKGAQDTLFKPAIAPLIAASRRATAFGVFDAAFGIAWLAGSIVFGLLYSGSLTTLVVVSVAAPLLSIPLFIAALRVRIPLGTR